MTDRLVTLLDGRQVSNRSEDWRHECEARWVARLQTRGERHDYLGKVQQRRGLDARRALQSLAEKIFHAERMGAGRVYEERK